MPDVTKAVTAAAFGDEGVKAAGARILASVVTYRSTRITALRDHLNESIDQLYLERNLRTRKALCDDINYTIDRIDELLLKNIDDAIAYEQVILVAAEQQKVDPENDVLSYIQ